MDVDSWLPYTRSHICDNRLPLYLHKMHFSSEFLIKATPPHLQGLCSNQPFVLHTVKTVWLGFLRPFQIKFFGASQGAP